MLNGTPNRLSRRLAFFIDYLKQVGLFGTRVADYPLSSPNAPSVNARGIGAA